MNTAIDQALDGEDFWDEDKRIEVMRMVRGTVQADILKEDQAQNTCILSLDFALKLMGDIQEFFSKNEIKNYYTVSVSGYHIAEAGANPITQMAFTIANGFTLVEYYLGRGMDIDQICDNISFFFSNGLDPEYAVILLALGRAGPVVLLELPVGEKQRNVDESLPLVIRQQRERSLEIPLRLFVAGPLELHDPAE